MLRSEVVAHLSRVIAIPTLLAGLFLSGCVRETALEQDPSPEATVTPSPVVIVPPGSLTTEALLNESWQAYRQRFIQTDGRVIDLEAGDRTTSEGQAYAMLRAVMINDPETFDRVLQWAEDNLQRQDANNQRTDSLWAWKWGKDPGGEWGILDGNFASDADVDAVTALILASRRWDRPEYLDLARIKLKDLWELSVVAAPAPAFGGNSGIQLSSNEIPDTPAQPSPNPTSTPITPPAAFQSPPSPPLNSSSEPFYYFLPGPKEAFQPNSSLIYLNPSYLAPYAYRLFSQVDVDHNWLSLVESSYQVLMASAQVSEVGLPSDWVALDTTTGQFLPLRIPGSLQSIYGFDAYRVWWRVSLDVEWFNDPSARQYLQEHLVPLQEMWRSQQRIPAQIDLQGQPLVTYDSTAQYAMLYPALRIVDPPMADEIRQQKLLANYQNGFWDNDSAYYSQNLAWFGLFPPNEVTVAWLQP